MPHRRGAPSARGPRQQVAATRAALLGTRRRPTSRPAASSATASCTRLWASTPSVSIRPALLSVCVRARSRGRHNSLESTDARDQLLSGQPPRSSAGGRHIRARAPRRGQLRSGSAHPAALGPILQRVAFRPTVSFCCIRRGRMGTGAVRHGPHRTPSPVSQAAWAWRGQHRARHRPQTSTARRAQSGAWHAVGGSTPDRPEPALRPGGPLVRAWLGRGRGPAGGPGGSLLDLELPGLNGPGFLAASRPAPPRRRAAPTPSGGHGWCTSGSRGTRWALCLPGAGAVGRATRVNGYEVEAAPNGAWWVRQPGGPGVAVRHQTGRWAKRTAAPGHRAPRGEG